MVLDNDDTAKEILTCQDIEQILRRVLLHDKTTRKELRTWLVELIGQASVTKQEKRNLFTRLLHLDEDFDSEEDEFGHYGGILRQLMLLLCEQWPQKVIKLLDRNGTLIRHFFIENPKQISMWFKHFAGPGGREHKYGAKALSQFFFANRNEYWHELVWSGKHPQSPVSVAAKSHYFCELDVERTVERLIDRVDQFWDSEELWDSLENGDIVALNPIFFAEEIEKKMKGRQSREEEAASWDLLEDFLESLSFPTLCNRVLHAVPDSDLLIFANRLSSFLGNGKNSKWSSRDIDVLNFKKCLEPSNALLQGISWKSFDNLLLCCSCMFYGHRIIKILEEEDNADEFEEISRILKDDNVVFSLESKEGGWRFKSSVLQKAKEDVVLLIALDSWVVRYKINGWANNPLKLGPFLKSLGFEAIPEFEEQLEVQKKRKQQKRRKKKDKLKRSRRKSKRRKSSGLSKESASEEDSRSESEESEEEEDAPKQLTSWTLKMDRKEVKWTVMELKEELSLFLLCRWLYSYRKHH